jgi:SAM-dependent methyltransferase
MDSLGLKPYRIPTGRVDFGHLRRFSPISENFGYDREGGPVDRFYIETFLHENRGAILGRVLEIGDNEYTLRFGKKDNLQSEVLHIHEGNPLATIVGDLSNAPHICDNSFDCIILTQTLHLIYDFQAALDTCYRILKPGGTLLLTVPGITPIDHGEWKDIWFWSFTEASIQRLIKQHFPNSQYDMRSHGNVLAATSFLYGLGIKDLSIHELNQHDPHYAVIITAKICK